MATSDSRPIAKTSRIGTYTSSVVRPPYLLTGVLKKWMEPKMIIKSSGNPALTSRPTAARPRMNSFSSVRVSWVIAERRRTAGAAMVVAVMVISPWSSPMPECLGLRRHASGCR